MDDRELEGRLRSHLHATLDDARPSPELVAAVEMRVAVEPVRFGGTVLRQRPLLGLGFALAAAAVVVALAFGATLGRPSTGTGSSPSAAPSAVPLESWSFLVLAPTPALPSKTITEAAGQVLEARIRALGIGNFSGAIGNAIEYEIDPQAGGPSQDAIRQVLAAPGVVEFVPIPAGSPQVVPGQRLAGAEPALFGGEGVASIEAGTDQNGNPAVSINLTPTARGIFAEYTAAHIGEQVAIVLDGVVASAPVILSAIADGKVQITDESSSSGFALAPATRAILVGGALPQPWRGAHSPAVLITPTQATDTALSPVTDARLSSIGLDARLVSGQWRAVWVIDATGTFPQMCTIDASRCPAVSHETILVDAVTGAAMGFEQAP